MAKWWPVKACAFSQMSVYAGVDHWVKLAAGERVNGVETERTGAYDGGLGLTEGS